MNNMHAVTAHLDEELDARLEDYRKCFKPKKTRAQAVRELLLEAIEHWESKQKFA